MYSDILDLNTITNLLELNEPTDATSFFADLVGEFFTQSTRIISIIKQSIQQNDKLNMAAHLHNLKGASLNMGAIALAHVCETIEIYLQHNNLSEIRRWSTELELVYNETVQALELIRN